MKKIYLTLIGFAAALSAGAQLTQANHAPANGDTFSTFQCDTAGPGAAGQNMQWNFTVNTHSSIVNNYTVSTVNSPSYPGANVGMTSGVNNSSYFGSSSSSLMYYGGNISVGQLKATLSYSMPAIYAAYPMSYNTTSTSAIAGSMNITAPLPTTGNFSGTSGVLCDGTGSLTIAGSTYTNVTRVKLSQSFNFTTSLANGSLVQDSYQYYLAGVKAPIVTVETSTATTPLGTSSQTIVTRLTTVPSQTTGSTVGLISFTSVEGQVSVYPNPASSEVKFESSYGTGVSVSVYDLTGKLIDTKLLRNNSLMLNVEEYNKGLYIYRVNGADGSVIHTGKLTVVH